MALLEAILRPEWADRFYSFDAHWSASEEMTEPADDIATIGYP
ncbi:hypothetical protein [Streptomyces lunaelactis]|nr:hypothetical protein [Streptomyces lunaelactis]